MKAKIHTILFEGNKPRFEMESEFQITQANLGQLIQGSIMITLIPAVFSSFRTEDYDPNTGTIHGRAEMERPNCNAYKKDLVANGWTEIVPPA